MPADPRIEQFRKMAEADPDNELGHFSLGRAYLDAGNADGAIAALGRVIQLRPDMSKAYELLASAHLAKGQKDLAIEQLQRGVRVAHGRGDALARQAMERMLRDLGAAVPELAASPAPQAVGEGQVACVHCGSVGPRLERAPFRSALGQEILAKICQPCWREWLGMGTKVINELRLPMNDPQAQQVWERHMVEFLNLGT
jgi:Fe-S cluster biosynthesis and repair protein YggX